MVGSTDSHTSLATAAEENFFGKHSGKEPTPERWNHPILDFNGVKVMGWQQAASGYAGVWARENTREAIFEAMQRKEVYASTGPRMMVRFFGGWDFMLEDASSRLPADIGYRKGVPMGGDLAHAPAGKSPTFLVGALKDPIGGNLDRHTDHQGLVGQRRQYARKSLRCRLVRWSQARLRRQAASRWEYRGCGKGHVDKIPSAPPS